MAINVNLTKGASQANINDALQRALLAKASSETSAAEAKANATNASASADSAASSATSSTASSETATIKASIATTKASEASTSATNAATSANSASTSASSASGYATAAANSAAAASSSASSASTSATTATTQAGIATTQASIATTQATNASTSATNAATSETNSATSELNANNSEAAAQGYASDAQAASVNASGYATSASNSASAAATYASNASTSETNAANSASSASTSASNAATSESNASSSASAAASSVTSASSYASSASTSATQASNSATQAASSASSASQIVLGQSTGRANIKPVLNLDFANQKRLDSKVDFTRTSTATYYDGNKQVKAEENLFKYSEDLSRANFMGNGTSEHNVVIAPDGTLTASKVTDTDKTTYLSVILGFFADVGYTRSIYAKVPSGTAKVTLTANNSNGVVTLNEEWQRFTLSNVGSTISNKFYLVDFRHADCTATEVHIWHPQLEQRDFATAYTPTLDKPITNYIPVLSTAQANEPRFDYDLETKECKGLLFEEQRTNLFTYSEDLSLMSPSGVTTMPSAIVSPLGTLSWKVIATTGNRIYKSVTTTETSYTFSAYVKKDYYKLVYLRLKNNLGNEPILWIDLDTQEILSNSNGYTVKIEPYSNGWFRVSTTVDIAFNGSQNVLIGFANSMVTGGVLYNDMNGYDGIFLTGLQLEQGLFATSYIPTNGSQVTRTADNCSISGDNFSSWYRQDEGTFYAEGNALADVTNTENRMDIIYTRQDSSNTMIFGVNSVGDSNVLATYITNNNVAQVHQTQSLGGQQSFKAGFSYKFNDTNTVLSGVTDIADTSCIIPTVSTLYIGSRGFTQKWYIGHLKKIAYYPKRLTDTELQLMTQG